MKTENLRRNQLARDEFDWYLGYLAAMDARDIDLYARYLGDECTLGFNNEEPTQGKAQIVARLRGYWQSFASVEHDLLNIYGTSQNFMLEALNHYTRLDGGRVTCRAVALTDRNDTGLVTSVRLYTDVSPVFAKA